MIKKIKNIIYHYYIIKEHDALYFRDETFLSIDLLMFFSKKELFIISEKIGEKKLAKKLGLEIISFKDFNLFVVIKKNSDFFSSLVNIEINDLAFHINEEIKDHIISSVIPKENIAPVFNPLFSLLDEKKEIYLSIEELVKRKTLLWVSDLYRENFIKKLIKYYSKASIYEYFNNYFIFSYIDSEEKIKVVIELDRNEKIKLSHSYLSFINEELEKRLLLNPNSIRITREDKNLYNKIYYLKHFLEISSLLSIYLVYNEEGEFIYQKNSSYYDTLKDF